MRQIVRYKFGTIPSKLSLELRITIDERSGPEYTSTYDGGQSTNITVFPIIVISITRSAELDENGNRVRAPWNPGDSMSITKFNIPILIRELKAIQDDMSTPDLYTYHGERLELNEEAAEKIRRVFMLGNTTLELSAVVISSDDDTKLEGIKFKINNEQSAVNLTLNELAALIYNLETLDVDNLTFQLYLTYIKNGNSTPTSISQTAKPTVDIKPLAKQQYVGSTEPLE